MNKAEVKVVQDLMRTLAPDEQLGILEVVRSAYVKHVRETKEELDPALLRSVNDKIATLTIQLTRGA